jgi:hypothetical protein
MMTVVEIASLERNKISTDHESCAKGEQETGVLIINLFP